MKARMQRLALYLFSGKGFVSRADQALDGVAERGNKTPHENV